MRATCWPYHPAASGKVSGSAVFCSSFALLTCSRCLFYIAAQFGTEHYNLVWESRVGFAKVAKQANVPIIPVFTQNIREAFRTVQLGRSFFRWIYDKYRFPLMQIYGGFPVKLKTIVGKPIYADPEMSVEQIAEQVSTSIFLSLHHRMYCSIAPIFPNVFPYHVFGFDRDRAVISC